MSDNRRTFPVLLLVVFCAALAVALLFTSGCTLANAVANAYAIPRLHVMPEPIEYDDAEMQCVMFTTTGQCQVWAVVPDEGGGDEH